MAVEVTDALGRTLTLPAPARRIVSLVPSTTETLFALGVVPVGRTAYGVHPPEARTVPAVGGTKDPDLERIRALAPDLVLANAEENRREDVEALSRAGIPVYVGFPRTVDQVRRELADLGRLTGREEAARRWIEDLDRAAADLRRRARPFRHVVLVWADPWLAAGPDTYAAGLLALGGGVNAVRDPRYPPLPPERLAALAPDVVFLPSEPYPFLERHRRALAGATALPPERFVRVDGRLLFWHGIGTARGLRWLARWLEEGGGG